MTTNTTAPNPPSDAHQKAVHADNPIRRPDQDLLGRTANAQSFANSVLKIDASEGVVVGVLGGWGSGKTSFINLASEFFKKAGATVLDFNPWMFSGTEQLVDSFFDELSAQLSLESKFQALAGSIANYGSIFKKLKWLPAVGPLLEQGASLADAAKALSGGPQRGSREHRKTVEAELAKLSKPLVVVIVDIQAKIVNLY